MIWFPPFMQADSIKDGQHYFDSKLHEKVKDVFKSIFEKVKSDLDNKELINETQ